MSLAWFLPLPGSYAGVDEVGVYNFACSLHEVLAKHPFLPHGCGLFSGSYFPSFSEGLSLRHRNYCAHTTTPPFPFLFGGTFIEARLASGSRRLFGRFPFLFGGTFIEASRRRPWPDRTEADFPSFSEGLSLRRDELLFLLLFLCQFPFLFGGTFIEAPMR